MALQVVILGSDDFPLMAAGMSKAAFAASAREMRSYFTSATRGLGLRDDRVLDLFACGEPIERQDKTLSDFLESAPKEIDGVVIYYVGHGGFLPDRQYYLAVKATDPKRRHYTGLKISDLAMTLAAAAPGRKVFLILDCCFAGAATDGFMADDLTTLVETKTFENLPQFGTALLVASSKDEPALTPDGNAYTMLAEALLETLRNGTPDDSDLISFRQAAEHTAGRIRAKWGHYGVRPEVHTPRQTNGDIADQPLFPNYTPLQARARSAPSVMSVLYKSRNEQTHFKSWTVFHRSSNPAARPDFGARHVGGKPTLALRTYGEESVGANKDFDALRGIIRFNYRVAQRTDENIVFFLIPLVYQGRMLPGRPRPLVELGTAGPGDPASGHSEFRGRHVPDRTADGGWRSAEVGFDFSGLDEVRAVVFAPRINEGVRSNGPGQVFLADVEILAYE